MKTKSDPLNGIEIVLIFFLIYGVYLCYKEYVYYPQYYKEYFNEYEIVSGRFLTLRVVDVGANQVTRIEYEIDDERFVKELNYIIPCRESYVKNKATREEIMSHRFPVAISSVSDKEGLELLTPYHFHVLGLNFPDSLSYMYETYFRCTAWEKFNADD